MAISILNYYEQPDGKNLMIMADNLYERNPGEAPDDNMPMDPTNYAISQNLGVPADGSIMIVRDFDEDKKVKTVTNVFNEGEWKNSTEGGGSGEIKTGYLDVSFSIESGSEVYSYDPKQLLALLEENDMVVVKTQWFEDPVPISGFCTNNEKQTIAFPLAAEYVTLATPITPIGEEDLAKIVDLIKTKNVYPIMVEYT